MSYIPAFSKIRAYNGADVVSEQWSNKIDLSPINHLSMIRQSKKLDLVYFYLIIYIDLSIYTSVLFHSCVWNFLAISLSIPFHYRFFLQL